MKQFAIASIVAALLAMPAVSSAHEHQSFRIGGKTYVFTIGSLNEPVTVDDKTGVDLMVELETDHAADAAHVAGDTHAAAEPVLGLEKTLKVELQAAGKTKELPLTTQYGAPGSYKAVFFPTVATTLTYRIFGTIDGQKVDLSFTCNPAGHPVTPEDTSEVKLSETVTRVAKSGSFGCPSAKADLGFPEPSSTLREMSQESTGGGSPVALALGAAGLALACVALFRTKRG